MSTNPPDDSYPPGPDDQGGDDAGAVPPPPPPYGNQPPPYGNQPPPYGNQPPPYGNQPPPYGYQSYPTDAAAAEAARGGGGLQVGDAIGYGWRTFWANWTTWLLAVLLYALIQVAISAAGGFESTTSARSLLSSLVAALVGLLMQSASTRAALDETSGTKATLGTFFTPVRFGVVVLAGIIVYVLTAIGLFLLIIPGLVVSLLALFVYQFVLDAGADAFAAISGSFSLIWKNFGTMLGLAILLLLINLVGALLCLVGLLVTVPLSILATTYAYRVLNGQPVAQP